MDAEPAFVDTNVLVYASRTRAIQREYLAVVTRPQAEFPALAPSAASGDLVAFMRDFNIAEDSSGVTARLLDLLTRYRFSGRQVYDANIVATMLEHGLRRLLTFNAADFRRFADVIELEPLPTS